MLIYRSNRNSIEILYIVKIIDSKPKKWDNIEISCFFHGEFSWTILLFIIQDVGWKNKPWWCWPKGKVVSEAGEFFTVWWKIVTKMYCNLKGSYYILGTCFLYNIMPNLLLYCTWKFCLLYVKNGQSAFVTMNKPF